jgi:putative ubiquitin-RnfH superfamily antitoxin RatB of RatAB toxin-antitoxin module
MPLSNVRTRSMAESSELHVEVACALPDRQRIVGLRVPRGTSARAAVNLSNIQDDFPELSVATSTLGVFGKVVADTHELREGDRVEIYRALARDPREARRILAARGETMGRKGNAG